MRGWRARRPTGVDSEPTSAPASSEDRLVCTVSTVKDSPDNVRRFVARNLAAGADHMFVFLDGPQPEVEETLAEHPHVTAVVTDRGYWQAHRPAGLNTRQSVNANLVRVLLTPFPWAAWLFHIDSDECLDVDRDLLMGLGEDVSSVQLQTLEAVSIAEGFQGPDEEQPFKRLLEEQDLQLLQLLGLVSQPTNTALFNGYTHGKAGMRPSLDHQLHIHRAKDLELEPLASFEHPDLRVLHYDSTSLAEFTRKWASFRGDPLVAVYGRKKDTLRAALSSVVNNPHLTDERRDHYIAEVYARTMQDDVETLDELGFLERFDPARHGHTSLRVVGPDRDRLDHLATLLTASDKNHFRNRRSPSQDPWHLLDSLDDRLRAVDEQLADDVRKVTAPHREVY